MYNNWLYPVGPNIDIIVIFNTNRLYSKKNSTNKVITFLFYIAI